MIVDIVNLNNFVVLIEQSNATVQIIQECALDNDMIGFSFYGSGQVDLSVRHGNDTTSLENSTGLATSFFGNKKVAFEHSIYPDQPLKSISVFSSLTNLKKMSIHEKAMFENHLELLLKSKEDFCIGPAFFMTPEMLQTVAKVFENKYSGAARIIFVQSQIMELLTHFFALSTNPPLELFRKEEMEKLYLAKEIMSENMQDPPSLSELSKIIGLNDYKLKKNFKELFGVPVFKYLQNERLNRAHLLLSQKERQVKDIAYEVGYESLSSFSKAFFRKFGYRPSQLNK